jgi:hypothetical protein
LDRRRRVAQATVTAEASNTVKPTATIVMPGAAEPVGEPPLYRSRCSLLGSKP